MPQFDFPSSPVVDQKFEQNGLTFIWTGKVWNYVPPDVRTEIEIQLDRKVSIAGDWMQGHLGLPHGDPIDPHHAASKAYVDRLTGGIVFTTDEPPPNVQPGTLWWESDGGYLYIYYDDGDSRQWVQVVGGMSGTTLGGAYIGDTPPSANTIPGMMWWDSDKGALYVLYKDVDSEQWVQIDSSGGGGGVEEAPTDGVAYSRQMAGWVPASAAAATLGDMKYGFQVVDHGGWIKLDGRAITALTGTQQQAAATFGWTANLPNGDGAVPMQNPTAIGQYGSVGTVAGSMTKNIEANNLPSVTVTTSSAGAADGTTSSAGAHAHNITVVENDGGRVRWSDSTSYGGNHFWDSWNATYDNGVGKYTKPLMDSGGAHTHTMSVPAHTHTFSLNSGARAGFDITPRHICANAFVFLGA